MTENKDINGADLAEETENNTINGHKRKRTVERLTTIARENQRKDLRICVGDKVALDDDKEGYVHFIGPVQTDKKGLVEYYGIEIMPPNEGQTNGNFYHRQCFFPKNPRSAVLVPKQKITAIVKRKGNKDFFLKKGEDKKKRNNVFWCFLYMYNINNISINGLRLTIHDKVKVKGRSNGEVKFIGPTLFGPNVWYGVELDSKLGRNNGMVQGVRYFQAQAQTAVFVREEALIPLGTRCRPIPSLSRTLKKLQQTFNQTINTTIYKQINKKDKSGNPKQFKMEYQPKAPIEMASDLFEACAKGDLKTVRAILAIDKTVAKHAVDPHTEASALMTACYHGFHAIVHELLITKQIDVNETNYHGLNALHFTAQAGFDNIAELLIKHGVDVDMRTEDGITALYIAVEKGHELVVEKLLTSYADVNLSSREDESPLIQACHRGYDKIVKRLLRAPNIRVNQRRKNDGATALFVACREGHTECVRELLSNIQIHVNESKTNGRSPLFIAAFFGHLNIVDILLKHSEKMNERRIEHGIINVDQSDSKGFTPLFVAAQNGHTEIVKFLYHNILCMGRGHTPLWISGLRGHVDVVRVLLAHPNIDIDYKDLSGVTALWAACQNNNVNVVELLLHPRDVEAKVETQGHSKKLTLASSEGLFLPIDEEADKNMHELDLGDLNLEKLEKSRESEDEDEDAPKRKSDRKNEDAAKKGNSENTTDDNRDNAVETPTDNSTEPRHAHRRTNSRLLWRKKGQRKGADPNLAKHDGCTPLWIAASRGNHECRSISSFALYLYLQFQLTCVAQQLTMFAFFFFVICQGATPLFVACQNGKKEAVDLLLGARADVNKPRNGDGTTPLMMAAHNGHSDIVDVLLRSGADPMRSNSTGLNALGCAAMQGHARIVKLCYQHLCRVKTPESIRNTSGYLSKRLRK
ncbi:hypothetical protein RFI_10714 [Reticulomyxa filosa]|uniref:CAP-Gly domain-containing protein n=1 Tax=Reticulomyxa filosa TaxID=46433 RepID=X6NKJ9_RETFI|nr:hypothetical protein RFI_10714 [Reticulomyxa filosa]|eukprot:ETO26423.1 hypothetical protein RFI_10714 [Reticulomyxa filosa]